MDNNASESGSRVTRSLRKRLTSVDSDNSSRPGTPVASKLIAISEMSTASPSRSTRITRRNSTTGVATPVKTPAKRGAASSTAIVENTETVTPARRSTRRRSVSVIENEEVNQSVLKTPAFSSVNEETKLTTTRVTRSQSNSPQQMKLQQTTATATPSPKRTKSPKTTSSSPKQTDSNQKRRKPGPKSKTRDNNEQENDSDVEISVLGNEMENIKNKSKSIPTIILTDDESNQTTKTNNDETSQKNKISDDKEVSNIPDGEPAEAEKEKSVTMKVISQTDNTNMNTDEIDKEKSDTMKLIDQSDNTNKEAAEVEKEKSVTVKVVDQEQAVETNNADKEVLNKTEIQTDDKNMEVNKAEVEKEKPESTLENLESESTTMHELRVDEDTTETTELNNISLKLTETEELPDPIKQNEEKESKISSQADNIENTNVEDQNDHPIKENELNLTTAQTVATESSNTHDDAGEQNKILDNKTDQTESVEKKTSLETEIVDTNDDKDSNLHLENEAKLNESVKNVTLTEKEKNKTTDTQDTVAEENILVNEKCNESSNEKDIHTNANENIESMEVDEDDDVIVNNTLNVQDSNDVKSEQETKKNSSTIHILDSTDNKINVENPSTPKSKGKSSEKIEIISVSTLTPYHNNDVEDANESVVKDPSKKVEFIASPSNDMTIKNVYPKTPASAKISNSFIEINSSPDDGSFHAEIKQELEDNNVESSSQVDQKMTPIRGFKLKRSLETVQSSTPINVEALKPEVESEPEKGASLKDDQSKEEEIKWINPNVKGTTTEGSKLDAVVTSRNDTSASKVIEIDDSIVQTHKKKSIIFSSEDEEEDNEHLEREDDDQEAEEELAEGEKPYKRKHDFHDDEAMEVDGYESGDSMDSEERREIEENEIPVDGESIGSHTTEDENDESVEEEESDNADSFIVSDNEEVIEQLDSNEEDYLLDDEEEQNDHNRKKKKTYKRLQRPADSSSSEDEEEEKEKVEQHEELKSAEGDSNNNKQLECPKESPISQSEGKKAKEIKSDLESFNKSNENMLDTSKLSDSALRLQCTAESESEDEDVNTANKEIMNISRKEILRKLNQSDRFNKSVRDLNPEVDTSSPADNYENDSNEKETADDQDGEEGEEEHSTSTSSEASAHNSKSKSRRKQSESHLGEVSVTSESDGDKENQHHSLRLPQKHKHVETGLSVSFGNCKKPKGISKGRQEWQRSFTIDVSVKDGDLKTEITDIKQSEGILSSSDTSTTSNDERENEELQSEDINYLENIRHIPLPLGNPLIRTRRQSLALPTNPDMEICSSSHGASSITGKKLKRKSLGVLSNSEFNPSQSFIDSIELQKSELVQQMGKRKRLSKSFCGAAESLDSSIIDIDVRHLHKRSKLLSENSMAESHHDSMENMNTSKISTKHSSTPHQKKLNENDSNNNIQHILNRCDEILEAANRAKLEAKLNNKKNKGKLSKKLRKKSALKSVSDETNSDDALRRVSMEIKRKDKIKTVLQQALKAGNAILGKKKHMSKHKSEEEEVEYNDVESKKLPTEILRAIEEEESANKKKTKKDNRKNQEKNKIICTASTSAGNFVELPQTPEKKKKKTFIQLPTGKVCVEPVTPQKRSVQAFNGAEFRESPVTPYAAGFKIRQIPKPESNSSSSDGLKNGKRKRHYDEKPKEHHIPKSQWTPSGFFIEEEIPKNRRITSLCSGGSHKIKKHHTAEKDQNVIRNFKESALMRPEVKRANKREILLLKERRQMQSGHY